MNIIQINTRIKFFKTHKYHIVPVDQLHKYEKFKGIFLLY